MQVIREHPAIEWWCTSALPQNCFDEEETEELKRDYARAKALGIMSNH